MIHNAKTGQWVRVTETDQVGKITGTWRDNVLQVTWLTVTFYENGNHRSAISQAYRAGQLELATEPGATEAQQAQAMRDLYQERRNIEPIAWQSVKSLGPGAVREWCKLAPRQVAMLRQL